MKKLLLGILAITLVVVFVAPSFAWEFSMTGDFEWRYRYFGRANGSKDLFGDMNYQDVQTNGQNYLIGFAGPNFLRGFEGQNNVMLTGYWGDQVGIVKGGFSRAGSDAYANDQRMTFVPSIKVNNAVRLHGTIDFSGIRQRYNHLDYRTNGPLDRWYQDRVSGNGTDTAMTVSVSQWRLTTQLPWGVLSLGAKDFPFGTGSLFARNTRGSALLFVLPYGPFRILPSIWLARGPDGYESFMPYWQFTQYGPPRTAVNYDGATKNSSYWSLMFTYDNGPLEIGGGFVHQLRHLNAVDCLPSFSTWNFWNDAPFQWTPKGSDLALALYNMYMKYNNGRFFANMEYNFATQDIHYLASGIYNGGPPRFRELSQAFAEMGALLGPAKIAGMFAWAGGPVLNNYNKTKAYGPLPINYQATDAYNYLLFRTYGGGNDMGWKNCNNGFEGSWQAGWSGWQDGGVNFTNDENGQMGDAYCLAVRLDYAAAANLNLWGSYMWAHRVEKNGFFAGGKSQYGGTGTTTVALAQTWRATYMGGGGNQNPYVDDGYLGWEANLGANWKLLENFSVNTRYAYWQPGPWFNEAYQVVGISNGTPSGTDNLTGAYLSDRSAIQAFECSVVVDF